MHDSLSWLTLDAGPVLHFDVPCDNFLVYYMMDETALQEGWLYNEQVDAPNIAHNCYAIGWLDLCIKELCKIHT